MLFTGKGDDGTTSLFGQCGQRLSKDDPIIEALGSLDELNSFLGICKAKSQGLVIKEFDVPVIIHDLQENLFIVQAEVAKAPKSIVQEKVDKLGELIGQIEKHLPEIKGFKIAGTTDLGAHLDYARALSRHSERQVLKSKAEISEGTKAYLNRLSSILYALARLVNNNTAQEQGPQYK